MAIKVIAQRRELKIGDTALCSHCQDNFYKK